MLCVPARVSLITALPCPAEQMSLPAALGAPEWLPVSRNQTPTPPPPPHPHPNNHLPAAVPPPRCLSRLSIYLIAQSVFICAVEACVRRVN